MVTLAPLLAKMTSSKVPGFAPRDQLATLFHALLEAPVHVFTSATSTVPAALLTQRFLSWLALVVVNLQLLALMERPSAPMASQEPVLTALYPWEPGVAMVAW